jgi:hypothetical protein
LHHDDGDEVIARIDEEESAAEVIPAIFASRHQRGSLSAILPPSTSIMTATEVIGFDIE